MSYSLMQFFYVHFTAEKWKYDIDTIYPVSIWITESPIGRFFISWKDYDLLHSSEMRLFSFLRSINGADVAFQSTASKLHADVKTFAELWI